MIQILDARGLDAAEAVLRNKPAEPDVTQAVAEILQAVKAEGDAALLRFTKQFDKAEISSLRVAQSEIEDACQQVGPEFLGILEQAAANIRAFHTRQKREGFIADGGPGVIMGQRVLPLASVGVYVPGGTAAYPSTVLMDAIPAGIAGVRRVVMVTPPGKDGQINAGVLAAASVAGVTEIYRIGGAQAVAALCYGTQSIARVDKIVGPGNLYVATAKRLVYGLVDIDMIAGPSDVLVVADETATAEMVAADMLAQAEHDPLASAVLVTTSSALAQQVQQQLPLQLSQLARKGIAEASIRNNGRILLAASLTQAMQIANEVAPEHLEICVEDPFSWLPLAQNAGSVFLGHNTPEALGDYFAGPNHTLPTGGTARFSSPLSVDDFVKKSSYLYYSKNALQAVGNSAAAFADAEGLNAHAASVRRRLAQSGEEVK
ncbi:MAG: histidinol dehydrogenase [Oscillospiraceae bacterium]